MVICYLGIGSNLGKRKRNIELAVKEIHSLKGTEIIRLSRIIETNPVGGPAKQRKFLNACLSIKTNFTAAILLKNLQKIEQVLGRTRALRWGARAIDLDILFYGNKIINTKKLKIPHPRLFEREFVRKTLLELV